MSKEMSKDDKKIGLDEKYVVLHREDWERIFELLSLHPSYTFSTSNLFLLPIPDAVVIRRQDIFAAPALHSYANSILVALQFVTERNIPEIKRLREIADYFHQQAQLAEEARLDGDAKVPD